MLTYKPLYFLTLKIDARGTFIRKKTYFLKRRKTAIKKEIAAIGGAEYTNPLIVEAAIIKCELLTRSNKTQKKCKRKADGTE